MQWYYSKNSTQLGPVSLDELRNKLATGEVVGTDMVWREGMPDWRRASEISELMISTTSPQPVVMAPQPGETTGNSPYRSPVTTSYSPGMLIPNYLWQSIVVTIFCCWPLGIPAIVYAAKVDGLRARGDIPGAMAASTSAKNWCWAAVGSWLVLIVIWIFFAGVMGFASYQSSP